jgi:hypothetical protein
MGLRVAGRRGLFAVVGVASAFAFVCAMLVAPATAHAVGVTRKEVVQRAKAWVHKRVRYDQKGAFQGYRRDCSGMVSMAWRLDESYTTATIASKAVRIKIANLSPGDAVLTESHVTLFEGWKNKRTRTYYALELYTTGKPARRVVKTIPGGAKALRCRYLKPRKATPKVFPATSAVRETAVP